MTYLSTTRGNSMSTKDALVAGVAIAIVTFLIIFGLAELLNDTVRMLRGVETFMATVCALFMGAFITLLFRGL